MVEKINKYFTQFGFDIRKTHNGRFTDQKVTPDVLTIVSDCILNYVNNNQVEEFTSTDVWKDDYSNENVIEIFGKTNVDDPKAKNEYDKFFQQPLKALAYAQVLREERKGNQIIFRIINKNILEYIAIRERNALYFLQIYLEKVLKDSHIWYIFDDFFRHETKEKFSALKRKYEKFIIANTPINTRVEVRRIFTKVLNPLAFKYKKLGTRRGFVSQTPIQLDELYYNRINWRDIAKPKDETRQEFESRVVDDKENAYHKYSLQKAKKIILKYHSPNSEVQDEFANGEATQIHHIFMKSDFPSIGSYLENLILLTPTQHFTKAHPSNNTRLIDTDYQKVCLEAKANSIEKFPDVYSKEDFEHVVRVGSGREIV